jgi:RNA polymerase sigma factor (sigma-70 family)
MSEATAPLSHGRVPVAGLRLLGDDRLARRAAEGDGQAFAALYQRHHQAIYRYCRAILGNAEDAADALQNTMTAALRALPGERREIHVKPWLFKIAHNESITLLRRRPPTTGLDEAINVAAPRGSDADSRERLRELVTDLRELHDRQRAALVMRELSGLEYAEIGTVLGSTPAAAKQLVFEARTALHEMADGRDMSCDSVRRSLSAEDRRRLRGRKLRAHLKACAGCREFQTSMDVRQRDLAAIAPPLPAIAAASLLHGLGGGAHGGGAGGLTGLAGSGAGKAIATSAVAKGLTTVAVVATVGVGTAGVTGHLHVPRGHRAPLRDSRVSAPATPRAGSPTTSQSNRSAAGPADRAESAVKRHRKGLQPQPGTHRPGQHGRLKAAGRIPPHSRPAVSPRRSNPHKPVSSQRGGSGSRPAPGIHKRGPSAPTTKAPVGKPSDPPARPHGTIEQP